MSVSAAPYYPIGSIAAQMQQKPPPPQQQQQPKEQSLYTRLREEARTNIAFRLTLIGAIITVVGSLLTILLVAFRFKLTPPIFTLLLVTAINTALIALIVYTNYCLVHGQCMTWALVQGILVLVLSVLIVIPPLVALVSSSSSSSSSGLTWYTR